MATIIEGTSTPALQAMAQKCLACGHTNRGGEDLCAACGSSLHLKLCTACEAINATGAERCHACSAALSAESAAPRLPSLQRAIEMPAPRRRQLTALLVLPIGATVGLAWYVYGGAPPAWRASTATAEQHAGAPAPARAPVAPSAASAPVKSAEAPRVAPAAVPKAAAPAVAATQDVARVRVTHTKAPAKADGAVALPAVRLNSATGVRPVSSAETTTEACGDAALALGFCTRKGGQ